VYIDLSVKQIEQNKTKQNNTS